MSRNFYFRMIFIQILKWYDIEVNIHGEKRSKYICYFICSLIYTSIIHICFDLHVTMVTTTNKVELSMGCKNPDD